MDEVKLKVPTNIPNIQPHPQDNNTTKQHVPDTNSHTPKHTHTKAHTHEQRAQDAHDAAAVIHRDAARAAELGAVIHQCVCEHLVRRHCDAVGLVRQIAVVGDWVTIRSAITIRRYRGESD